MAGRPRCAIAAQDVQEQVEAGGQPERQARADQHAGEDDPAPARWHTGDRVRWPARGRRRQAPRAAKDDDGQAASRSARQVPAAGGGGEGGTPAFQRSMFQDPMAMAAPITPHGDRDRSLRGEGRRGFSSMAWTSYMPRCRAAAASLGGRAQVSGAWHQGRGMPTLSGATLALPVSCISRLGGLAAWRGLSRRPTGANRAPRRSRFLEGLVLADVVGPTFCSVATPRAARPWQEDAEVVGRHLDARPNWVRAGSPKPSSSAAVVTAASGGCACRG